MTREQYVSYPQQIPATPKPELAIFVSMDKGLFTDRSIAESFRGIDAKWKADRYGNLQTMAGSTSTLMTPDGGPITMGYLPNLGDPRSRRLWADLSPLNDGPPETSALTMFAQVSKPNPSKTDTAQAKQNTWNPVTKFSITKELLDQEGLDMAAMKMYAREDPAFTDAERKAIWSGDTRPFGRILLAMADEASRRRHEQFGDGGFTDLDINCQGMPQKAIGAARYILENTDRYNIRTVTAMNLPLDTEALVKTAWNYGRRRLVGEAGEIILPSNYTKVPELLKRRDIDRGSEFIGTRKRQVQAMMDWRVTFGTFKRSKEKTAHNIEWLMDRGVVFSLANALNNGMVERTDKSLPSNERRFFYTDLVGVDGHKLGPLTGEHAALVAYVAATGIHNFDLAA